jgi:AcrR family transcriptional regulator
MVTRTPNPATPAGERILATASTLFYERGIRAVGVDAIALEAGTTKKTLYDRFGSKDALVAAYLVRRADRWRSFLEQALGESRATGTDRALAVFDVAEEWAAANERGCAFVNAFAEIGGTDHPANAVILEDKGFMHDIFVRLLTEAGVGDADALGGQLHLLYEGAIVVSTAGGRADAFETARAAARSLLKAATQRR